MKLLLLIAMCLMSGCAVLSEGLKGAGNGLASNQRRMQITNCSGTNYNNQVQGTCYTH